MSTEAGRHGDDDGDTATASGAGSAAAASGARHTPPAVPSRGPGRLLGGAALLVALAALGAAGYLYYELIHRGMVDTVAHRLAVAEREVADVDAALERLAEADRRQQSALAEFRERREAELAATEEALRASLDRVARQAPPSTAEWQRAEVQYLLRIANHRLLMERDVAGALRLLQAADGILADLDDFALHPVRAALADEIAALEGVQGADVQGLFLRLEALKRDLDALPLRLPEYPAAPEPAAAAAAAAESEASGFWAALEERFAGMLRLRRFEDEVRPLLSPDEAVYLELNLRLMLERAQLAALRREQLVYQESLATAAEWIRRYLNTDGARAQRLLAEIESMQALDLERSLPDISGSLNALRETLRNPA